MLPLTLTGWLAMLLTAALRRLRAIPIHVPIARLLKLQPFRSIVSVVGIGPARRTVVGLPA